MADENDQNGSDIRMDGLKKRRARNRRLKSHLEGGWSDHDIVSIERVGDNDGGGWKVIYYSLPRPGT